jgi:hypothetical protein
MLNRRGARGLTDWSTKGFARRPRLAEDAGNDDQPSRRTPAMQTSPDFATMPGRRIGHYRNSARRFIKLYGLGATGATIARSVGERGLPNVQVRTGNRAAGWAEIAGDQPDPTTNMVVIVCGEGDEALFKPEREKPDTLVTFVLLQPEGNLLVVRNESVSNARGSADLFVTTSDRDYVADLIDNLAS